jgi:hypothetical protein
MLSSTFRSCRWGALLALALPVFACTAGGGGAKHSQGAGGSGNGGAGGERGISAGNGGSGLGGVGFSGVGGGSGGDAGHATRCDDAGNCSCIAIASIGHEGVWGPCSSDSTTALQTWLNTQSTAKVDNYDTTKPTLTPAFLAQYDVLILQWMVENGQQNNDGPAWVFSPDEVAALKTWVNDGGGLIALNGYQCNGSGCTIYDVTASNQLLSFTDIQFNSDDVLDPSQVSCQDCYCWGGSLPLGGALPEGGAPAIGTWDPTSPIGAHLGDVGAYVARSIHSTTATVDSTDGTHQFAVHEQIGKGHVFAYGDEWVTYSGEWLGTASCLNPSMFTNMYDPCYEKSAAQVFQIPQFWYNTIKYAASSVQCFTIQNPGIFN